MSSSLLQQKQTFLSMSDREGQGREELEGIDGAMMIEAIDVRPHTHQESEGVTHCAAMCKEQQHVRFTYVCGTRTRVELQSDMDQGMLN